MRSVSSQPEISLDSLSCGGQLFIWSLRQWLIAVRHKQDPIPLMINPYRMVKNADAPMLIDELMAILAVSSQRQLEIRCCCRATLSQDESLLLSCVRLLRQGNTQGAAESLEPVMLPGLSRTLCRIADLYQASLTSSGLTFENPRALTLV